MQTYALIMKRRPLAEGIGMTLEEKGGAGILIIGDYSLALGYMEKYRPGVALIEAAESGPFGADYCIKLAASIKADYPSCRLLLMVPEYDEAAVRTAIDGRRSGTIDDFVFFDAGLGYIASKLISM